MIKFFRVIRQRLLNENKFTKYLVYAIGEIVLVVIGILIALQINTWSNNKQAKLYEKKILLEIKSSLEKDANLFKRLEKRINIKDQAIDTLLLVRQKKLKLTEQQIIDAIEKASIGLLFSYDKGAYETLKSAGLERLKTDSIRNRLIRFYEVYLPRTSVFITNIQKYYDPLFNESEKELKKINLYTEHFTPRDSTSFSIRRKYDVSKIHTPTYYKQLILQSKAKIDYWYRIKNSIKETSEVLEIVKKELETRFKE